MLELKPKGNLVRLAFNSDDYFAEMFVDCFCFLSEVPSHNWQ